MARRVGGVAIIDLLELYDSGALEPNALQIKGLDLNRRDLPHGVALPQRWTKNGYDRLDSLQLSVVLSNSFTLHPCKIP